MLPLIVYIPIGFFLPFTNWYCGGGISGIYVPHTQTVYLCEGSGEFVKSHEIYHHIWFTQLTEEQRQDYTKAYNRDLKKGKSYFFREYSMTNVLEDFADNGALSKTKQKTSIQRRINLIKKWIS